MPDEKKRRVGKACDICRIKKIKCNGKKPCDKCLLENRVCTFLDRRRDRDKHYPPGYLELMETRNALLTKLLLRLVQLSVQGEDMRQFFTQKHPVLEKHAVGSESASDADAVVLVSNGVATTILINKVLNLLVNEEGLLVGEPVEWEEGTHIALDFSSANADSAAKAFAEHSKQKKAPGGSAALKKEDRSFLVPDLYLAPSMASDASTFTLLSPVLLLSDDKIHEKAYPVFLEEKSDPALLLIFDGDLPFYSDLTSGVAREGDLEWERLFDMS